MSRRAKITKRVIDAIVPPASGEINLWDSEVPGFGLRVRYTGSRVYVVEYRNRAQRKRRVTLGPQGRPTVLSLAWPLAGGKPSRVNRHLFTSMDSPLGEMPVRTPLGIFDAPADYVGELVTLDLFTGETLVHQKISERILAEGQERRTMPQPVIGM